MELYGFQQNLAKLQMSLEKAQENYQALSSMRVQVGGFTVPATKVQMHLVTTAMLCIACIFPAAAEAMTPPVYCL